MKWNRIFAVLLAVAACFMLTSCSDIGGDVDNILEAPQLTGDLFDIQQAVEKFAGGEIDLKYPKKGDYLSAFVLYDVDNDGQAEAVAFYSPDDTTTSDIYVAFVDNEDGVWTVLGSVPTSATDVEKVSFADINGDGIAEVIVGWNIFSKIDKQVAVYTTENGKFTQRLLENYTEYVVCDLMNAGYSQILTVNLDSTEKTSVAALYHLDGNGVVEDGNVSLDGGVTAYLTPVVSTLGSGRPAVYLDANRGTSVMITEIIYYSPLTGTQVSSSGDNQQDYSLIRTNALVSPFHDSTTFENEITSRPISAAIRDINGDGIMDIPLMTELPGFSSRIDDEKLYYTVWRDYDEKKFTNVMTTIMNYVEGYYFIYPEKWLSSGVTSITVTRNADSSVFLFSEWNADTQTRGADLFNVQVFTRDGWDNRDLDQYGDCFPIRYDKDYVYSASIVNSDRALSLTEDEIRNAFKLIEE